MIETTVPTLERLLIRIGLVHTRGFGSETVALVKRHRYGVPKHESIQSLFQSISAPVTFVFLFVLQG